MIGLMAIIVLGGLLALAIWAFTLVNKALLRHGKSEAVARALAVAAVVALSLPITWDAIPTWIAFEYYNHKEAGIQVFKTLEQWKAENPGVAETLEPYGVSYTDSRTKAVELADDRVRMMLNARFAYDKKVATGIFGIRVINHEIVDTKKATVIVHFVAVFSGNSGGLASGGDGWWKFWLLHSSSTSEQEIAFEKYKREFQFLENK